VGRPRLALPRPRLSRKHREQHDPILAPSPSRSYKFLGAICDLNARAFTSFHAQRHWRSRYAFTSDKTGTLGSLVTTVRAPSTSSSAAETDAVLHTNLVFSGMTSVPRIDRCAYRLRRERATEAPLLSSVGRSACAATRASIEQGESRADDVTMT
jgi:hypothetical protein